MIFPICTRRYKINEEKVEKCGITNFTWNDSVVAIDTDDYIDNSVSGV
jgi:hypothetical protein